MIPPDHDIRKKNFFDLLSKIVYSESRRAAGQAPHARIMAGRE